MSPKMQRREFITLLGGAAARPVVARAQQLSAKAYRIAIVHPSVPVADISESGGNPYYPAFFKELRRLGYVEGQNLSVARYSAEGRENRYTELSHDVVRTNPNIIVAAASRLVLSLKAATDTIPIVAVMADPVPFGIVASIARPGGNITGVSVEAGLARSRPDSIEGWVPRFASDLEPAAGECVAGNYSAVVHLSAWPAYRKSDR
jgi:putative ABC transport system substrate-binding protein